MVTHAQTVLGVTEPRADNGGGFDAAKVLRLNFHDCLKYTDGTGGCDGCLNWKGVGITYYMNKRGKRSFPDMKESDNNGLRHTVEVLEAIYTIPMFPKGAPELNISLKESGKSRADLWALAGIVAVEFGIETNNMKCQNPDSVPDQCHHLQGEVGCEVSLDSSIPFRTGRADCVPTDEQRPYIASKEEIHPIVQGDGSDTLKFFQEQFGFTGQETVAIMGAHTFGRLHFVTSMLRYTWTSRGTRMFNNDYYKMITDERRWYFDDDKCTKVGDAFNNMPVRRWLARYRQDTVSGGPVHWISENYVCPHCVNNPQNNCCIDVPEGQFCKADTKRMEEKTISELNRGCEAFRIIRALDEMALPCEMGLYLDFKSQEDGYPRGCPGLDGTGIGWIFDGTQTGHLKTWSEIDGAKADPGCQHQHLSVPASDNSTSWYMREYAVNQDRFIRDFAAAFDKMLSNGYTGLSDGWDQNTGVQCTKQELFKSNFDKWSRPENSDSTIYSQCWMEGSLQGDPHFVISSKLDGKVVEMNKDTGSIEMKTSDDSSLWQRWMIKHHVNSFQLVNVGSNQLLEVLGLSYFIAGPVDTDGYHQILINGDIKYSDWRYDKLDTQLPATFDCRKKFGGLLGIRPSKNETVPDFKKFKFHPLN